MTTMRFRPLLLVAALALLGSSGIARAGDDGSHRYCPRGASLYFGIFGYWCEDGTYAGVQPFACKSGPGQATGAWNNDSQTPDQLCAQQTSTEPKPVYVPFQ